MDSQLLAHGLEQALEKTDVIGASAAVIRHRSAKAPPEEWQGGVGFSDLSKQGAMPANAKFLTYSVVKTLIAALTLQQCKAHAVALDQSAAEIVAELAPFPKITIRNLLNHTSGLPDYGRLPHYQESVKAGRSRWSDAEFLQTSLLEGVLFQPGDGFHYSNVGYMQLRRLLEKLSGQSFAELAQQVFVALELQDTFVCVEPSQLQLLTPGYSRWFDSAKTQDVRAIYDPCWVAHGVLASTAADTAKMMDAVFIGPLLDIGQRRELVDLVTVNEEHALFRSPSYGLGLMIDPDSPEGFLAGHTGGGPGYQSACYHVISEPVSLTVAVLANTDFTHVAEALMFELMAVLPAD